MLILKLYTDRSKIGTTPTVFQKFVSEISDQPQLTFSDPGNGTKQRTSLAKGALFCDGELFCDMSKSQIFLGPGGEGHYGTL